MGIVDQEVKEVKEGGEIVKRVESLGETRREGETEGWECGWLKYWENDARTKVLSATEVAQRTQWNREGCWPTVDSANRGCIPQFVSRDLNVTMVGAWTT